MTVLSRCSPLEFGQMMIGHKDNYPLEVVGSIEYSDDEGVFYVPTVPDYVTGLLFTAGSPDGYETRAELCQFIGYCWDKAEQAIKD